ncbi:helix-turn-helix domain-containing protein [Micromonospora sp. RP3T]|uniref:helix-turn-helix domain-containing protein n=1 Tax=Micromonospora sp. RP3T TaxID=2135446 RepID=UPI003D73AEF4
MTTYTPEQIETIGGKPWSSGDGRINRVYINPGLFARLMGLEVSYYNTGNIRHAEINGEHISNAEAGRILASKVYLEAGKLHIRTDSRWHEDDILAAIATEVERTTTETTPADDSSDDDSDDAPGSTTPAGQVTALRAAGRTVRDIAQMVGVAVSTVYRWARGLCRPLPANAAALAALA